MKSVCSGASPLDCWGIVIGLTSASSSSMISGKKRLPMWGQLNKYKVNAKAEGQTNLKTCNILLLQLDLFLFSPSARLVGVANVP